MFLFRVVWQRLLAVFVITNLKKFILVLRAVLLNFSVMCLYCNYKSLSHNFLWEGTVTFQKAPYILILLLLHYSHLPLLLFHLSYYCCAFQEHFNVGKLECAHPYFCISLSFYLLFFRQSWFHSAFDMHEMIENRVKKEQQVSMTAYLENKNDEKKQISSRFYEILHFHENLPFAETLFF